MTVKDTPINFIISSTIELWGGAELLQLLKLLNLKKLKYVFEEVTA